MLRSLAQTAIEMLDEYGVISDPDRAPLRAIFMGAVLSSPALRIAGGTDEILHNIIAERVLGLPGEVRVDKDVPFKDLPMGRWADGPMTPKALLWDFGNVIVRWNPRTLYQKIFPDPADCDRFLAEVCTMAWHAVTDCGVTFAENCARLIAVHPQYEAEIGAWHERWAEMFSGPIAETEAAIEALHARGIAQYGLSNVSHETLDSTLAMSPAFGRLTGVVASGFEGVMKPDPAIFRLCCDRFGLEPGDFLFIDDSRHNIDAAAALGFDVHHFTDPTALAPALEHRGLI